jgi:glycosyltransferase involved in cell wall biosynthesis
VIAWPHGSVPEIITDGVSGRIVPDVDAAVRAVGEIEYIDRRRCRAEFETRFSAERMARDYVKIYMKVLSGRGPRSRNPGARCIA